MMKTAFRRLLESWETFWFAPRDPLPLGLFRFFFGLNLLLMYGLRHLDLARHFSESSIVTSSNAWSIIPESIRPSIELHGLVSGSPSAAHFVFLISILALTVGFFGRAAAFVALVLHLAFIQRNVSVVYGADFVASFWLLYLVVGENDRQFSVRAWWRAKKGGLASRPANWFSSALTTVSVRLVQIQLCVIYGYTGLEKLKGASWWEGTAVWAVFGNSQLMIADLSFLKSFPVLIGLMTHSAVLFEIYFPVLVWIRPIQKWILAFGILLHLGIAVGMGLYFFSGAMIAAYFVFAKADWLRSRMPMLFSGR